MGSGTGEVDTYILLGGDQQRWVRDPQAGWNHQISSRFSRWGDAASCFASLLISFCVRAGKLQDSISDSSPLWVPSRSLLHQGDAAGTGSGLEPSLFLKSVQPATWGVSFVRQLLQAAGDSRDRAESLSE